MCNLYHMSPRDDFEIYVLRHVGKLWLPEAPPKPIVGPFDTGMFLIPDGDGPCHWRSAASREAGQAWRGTHRAVALDYVARGLHR